MLRRTALLVIAFTLLVGAATTVASTGAQTLDVYYRDIKLVVNGAKVATPAEPFIHDGTTYVPLRAIGEALGQTVTWDGDSSTVYIGKAPGAQVLTDVRPYYMARGASWANDNAQVDSRSLTGTPMTMGGTRYNKGAMLDIIGTEENEWDWNLNGQFATLDGTMGLDDGKHEFAHFKARWYGDDKLLAEIEYQAGDLPKPVRLDLKGVLRLRLVITASGEYQGAHAYVDLVNMGLR